MVHYEAKLDGTSELGEAYTAFDEVKELGKIFNSIGWDYTLKFKGTGGYYRYENHSEDKIVNTLHIYLKKITFGGRENRRKEKRVQFSAAIDRTGFETKGKDFEVSLILGIYKRQEYEDDIICAWDIKDWGYNVGRAFNCFVDIDIIALALKNGFAQHRTSIGQIACCFRPEWFSFYLKNKDKLHDELLSPQALSDKVFKATYTNVDLIPRYDQLFELVLNILHSKKNGYATVKEIEEDAAGELELSMELRKKVHNVNEGKRTELGYQLAWARYYLKCSDLIYNPERSIWALTEKGLNTLKIDRSQIVRTATQEQIRQEDEEALLNDIHIQDGTEDIESEDTESESTDFNEDFVNPFDPNKVDIKTRTMSMDLILKRLDRGNIDLNTSFQRKKDLWNITKQSRLIESILIRFPLPAFYFDGTNDDNWLVVDGLQRLSSLKNYVVDQITHLENLEFLPQFNKKSFRELPPALQRRIEETEITAYVIAPGTPKELKYIVFRRINTGGLVLTSQEIRNAINPGKPSEFLKELAELKSFKVATSFSIPQDRMLDREFINRFLAFYIFTLNDYMNNLEEFLDRTLEAIKVIDAEDPGRLQQIKQDFDSAMKLASELFGQDAFRKKLSLNDKRKPINKALFEVWAVVLSNLDNIQGQKLLDSKLQVQDKFMDLQKRDLEFNAAITSSTSDRQKVRKRFIEINKLVHSILVEP